MRAVVYDSPGEFTVRDVPTPEPGPGEVRIRVTAAGMCGTDVHLHEGQFLATFPLTPGHETVGVVDAFGPGPHEDGSGAPLKVGQQVVVNPNSSCRLCGYCTEGRPWLCDEFAGIGSSTPGGFAEYLIAPVDQVFDATGMEPDLAVFAEPSACIAHAGQQRSSWQIPTTTSWIAQRLWAQLRRTELIAQTSRGPSVHSFHSRQPRSTW